MSTDDTAVQNQPFHVWIIGKMVDHVGPDARCTPACEAPVDTVPVTVLRRQLAPLGTGVDDPQHTCQEALARCFRPDIGPWMVAQKRHDLAELVLSYFFRHLDYPLWVTLPSCQRSTEPSTCWLFRTKINFANLVIAPISANHCRCLYQVPAPF
jgi:hypothetical protein